MKGDGTELFTFIDSSSVNFFVDFHSEIRLSQIVLEMPARQLMSYLEGASIVKIGSRNTIKSDAYQYSTSTISEKNILSNKYGTVQVLIGCSHCEDLYSQHFSIRIQSSSPTHELLRFLFFKK